MSRAPRKPEVGQHIMAPNAYDELKPGQVVDLLSSQFTYLPLGERDKRKVRFCFYSDSWKAGRVYA